MPMPTVPAGRSPLTTRITAAPVELGPGDLMEIAVLDTPEVSGRFRVNAAGEITMPLIGAVPVKGLPAGTSADADRQEAGGGQLY